MGQDVQMQQQSVTIQHGVTKDGKNVVMVYSAKVDFMTFTPAQAVQLVMQVLEGAKECDPSSVAGITWPPQQRTRSNG